SRSRSGGVASSDGPAPAARKNGNGNGNGNGHGSKGHRKSAASDGDGTAGKPRFEAPPAGGLREILGDAPLRVDQPRKALDKAKLLSSLLAFKRGDFSARLPIDLDGVDGKIADTFNDVIELNERMSRELERLSHVVG